MKFLVVQWQILVANPNNFAISTSFNRLTDCSFHFRRLPEHVTQRTGTVVRAKCKWFQWRANCKFTLIFHAAGLSCSTASHSQQLSRPLLDSYTKKKQEKQERAFQSARYDSLSWLEYFENVDACFCYACRIFARDSDRVKTIPAARHKVTNLFLNNSKASATCSVECWRNSAPNKINHMKGHAKRSNKKQWIKRREKMTQMTKFVLTLTGAEILKALKQTYLVAVTAGYSSSVVECGFRSATELRRVIGGESHDTDKQIWLYYTLKIHSLEIFHSNCEMEQQTQTIGSVSIIIVYTLYF